MTDGAWYYSPDHGQLCQIIETQSLWGETTCRVWLPGRDYRLNLLRQEKRSWNEELERKAQVYPEMVPLLLVRVEGGAHE